MYNIETDIENVARAIYEDDTIYHCMVYDRPIKYRQNKVAKDWLTEIVRAALNASTAVKELKELQEKALILINWVEEFQPKCETRQGSYLCLIEEYKDFKKAITPPKQKD